MTDMRQHGADSAPIERGVTTLVQRTLSGGLVGAAAVTGLLLGIGRQSGTAWRPLNAAAHLFIGSSADGVWNFHRTVTPTGGLVVLTMSVVAGFVVACVTASRRAPYVMVAAAGVAVVGYLLHVHVAARTPGGLASLLTVGELRAVYLTLGVALAVGIRFAFPDPAREPGAGGGVERR
jgi:hypothetical protein